MAIHAYNECYVTEAQDNLGALFDYALNDCQFELSFFSGILSMSHFIHLFETGNPWVISGMSGDELLMRILEERMPGENWPSHGFRMERTAQYWCGWALAFYQWYANRSFTRILERISVAEILQMYPLYHEMDIMRFVEEMERRFFAVRRETYLKQFRTDAGWSQKTLAQRSGVSMRMIQLYEQKENDINKAQAVTVCRLARALNCPMEALLEECPM